VAVDLHLHTTWSDGSLTPEKLVHKTARLGLSAIAITDHDEIGGIMEAQSIAGEELPEIIPGVELSVKYNLNTSGHVHIVGLFIDQGNTELCKALQYLKEKRSERAVKIVDKLQKHKINICIEEVKEIARNGSIGRPHIASLLIKKRYAFNNFQVFNRFLGKDTIGYVPKTKLGFKEAVNLIHNARGLTILAHPISLGYEKYEDSGKEILNMKSDGLDGIEVWYPSHGRYFSEWLLQFAQKENLAISGGSDFHGKAKPGVEPGKGRGNLIIGDSVVHELKKRL